MGLTLGGAPEGLVTFFRYLSVLVWERREHAVGDPGSAHLGSNSRILRLRMKEKGVWTGGSEVKSSPEDLVSVPSTRVGWLTIVCNSRPRAI